MMKACFLRAPAKVETNPLEIGELPNPTPGPGEILVRVEVCGVCRTDLHVIEGELPPKRSPVIPGHQAVGHVAASGAGATRLSIGSRVGVAWLHKTDGTCEYCRRGEENLCDHPQFTGYTVNGGYAEYLVAHRILFTRCLRICTRNKPHRSFAPESSVTAACD